MHGVRINLFQIIGYSKMTNHANNKCAYQNTSYYHIKKLLGKWDTNINIIVYPYGHAGTICFSLLFTWYKDSIAAVLLIQNSIILILTTEYNNFMLENIITKHIIMNTHIFTRNILGVIYTTLYTWNSVYCCNICMM